MLLNGFMTFLYSKQAQKYIPSDLPYDDEIEAIKDADESIKLEGTVPESSINWD